MTALHDDRIEATRRPDAAAVLVWTAVALGAVLRVRQWAYGRGFWLDECKVGINIVRRGFLGLLQPLDQNQSAPIATLWWAEAASRLFGYDERAMRGLALLTGCLGLVAVALLARAALPRLLWPVAVLLAALGPRLIYFSEELKAYSADLAAAALVTWLGLGAIRGGRGRDAILLGAGCCLVLPFSSAAVLVIAGVVGLVALEALLVRRDRRQFLRVAAASLAAAAVFAVHYAVLLRHGSESGYMHRFWAQQFPPPPWTLAGLRWIVAEGMAIPGRVVGIDAKVISVAAVLGTAWLAWRNPRTLAVVLAPAAVAYAAGVAHVYPVAPRLCQFLAPATLVLSAAALGWAIEALRLLPARAVGRRRTTVAATLVALAAVPLLMRPTRDAARRLVDPLPRAEYRDVLRAVVAQARPGDAFLVHNSGRNVYVYYAAARPALDLSRLGRTAVSERERRGDAEVVASEAQALLPPDGGGRVWVLYTNTQGPSEHVASDVDAILADALGRSVAVEATGAEAYAYGPRGAGAE